MKQLNRLIGSILALVAMVTVLFSAACAPANEIVLATTPEPTPTAVPTATPTAQPTLFLSMEQKAAMVWTGDDYRSYYPTEVFVFYGNINGTERLIWTSLENPETKDIFSIRELEYTGELNAYDLFNHEYLFALNVPQDLLTNRQSKEFYKYIKDISPSLKSASFSASQDIFNLLTLYKDNNINYAEIGSDYIPIRGYIYENGGDTIGPWDKDKAIEAFSAVTPSDYILPYWEFIPDTVMPADFYTLDSSIAAAEPTPMPELTFEQKKLLLGIDERLMPIELRQICLADFYFNKQKIRFCLVAYRNPDKESKIEESTEDEYIICDWYNIFGHKKGYLFTTSEPVDPETGRSVALDFESIEYIVEINPALEGMQPIILMNIGRIAFFYKGREIDYNDNEILNKWSDIFLGMNDDEIHELLDTIITPDELVRLFLDATDQEKILPFWKYVPGAQVPDELKEFYPDETTLPEGSVTPMPYSTR